MVARETHNLKVGGLSPSLATKHKVQSLLPDGPISAGNMLNSRILSQTVIKRGYKL